MENKLDPVVRHFDKVTGVNVVLSVEKLKQLAEVTVHVPGKDLHVEESADDLYAAIDALFDKLDRQVQKYKLFAVRPSWFQALRAAKSFMKSTSA